MGEGDIQRAWVCVVHWMVSTKPRNGCLGKEAKLGHEECGWYRREEHHALDPV